MGCRAGWLAEVQLGAAGGQIQGCWLEAAARGCGRWWLRWAPPATVTGVGVVGEEACAGAPVSLSPAVFVPFQVREALVLRPEGLFDLSRDSEAGAPLRARTQG